MKMNENKVKGGEWDVLDLNDKKMFLEYVELLRGGVISQVFRLQHVEGENHFFILIMEIYLRHCNILKLEFPTEYDISLLFAFYRVYISPDVRRLLFMNHNFLTFAVYICLVYCKDK